MRISDCPAAVSSIMALKQKAIAHLGEKALESGVKSEDQPCSVSKSNDPRCKGVRHQKIFVGYMS